MENPDKESARDELGLRTVFDNDTLVEGLIPLFSSVPLTPESADAQGKKKTTLQPSVERSTPAELRTGASK
jgi:hypothetical protein